MLKKRIQWLRFCKVITQGFFQSWFSLEGTHSWGAVKEDKQLLGRREYVSLNLMSMCLSVSSSTCGPSSDWGWPLFWQDDFSEVHLISANICIYGFLIFPDLSWWGSFSRYTSKGPSETAWRYDGVGYGNGVCARPVATEGTPWSIRGLSRSPGKISQYCSISKESVDCWYTSISFSHFVICLVYKWSSYRIRPSDPGAYVLPTIFLHS